MSGGLLFGHEVKTPRLFLRPAPEQTPLPRPAAHPARDELEAYLSNIDLPLNEIARRMGWTCASITRELHLICQKRHLKGGRAALQQWWTQTHPPKAHLAA